VTISIPAACLTFSSAAYNGEIKSETPGRRRFRIMGAPIHPGDKNRVFATELGIDQLKMKDTYLVGDVMAVLADKVLVETIVHGERFTAERLISDFFPITTDTPANTL
jgi:hypothetical protein